MKMTKEEIEKYVEENYSDLLPTAKERVLQSYLAAKERKSVSLLDVLCEDVLTTINSTNYKEFLFTKEKV
jgi:hypothetical protein